jgi:Tetracyclin repressor-like, C-terminal domain
VQRGEPRRGDGLVPDSRWASLRGDLLHLLAGIPQRDDYELAGLSVGEHVEAAEPGQLAGAGQLFPEKADGVVDPGLVMHYYGSKEELFRRVIDAAPVPEISGTPDQAAEQILATLASRLASEPTASLTILRSMLTNSEAASAAGIAMARFQAQIAQAIPADDASLRAAVISAIILGITVSRHLIKSDELAAADPAQVISLLRPCMLSLAAQPTVPARRR